MQLFSKKNAKIILAVLVAICLAGCATKAPVEEVVVAPVAEVPVVEVVAPAPEPVPAPEPAPAPAPEPAPAPAPAPAVDVANLPIVKAIGSIAKTVVESAVGPAPVVPTVDKIAVPEGEATYMSEYELVGYKFVFKAIDNFVVFNYIETLTDAENAVAADNIAAMLPNVVAYGVAAPGSIVVEMSKPITSAAFDSFVEKMCAKAYNAIYPAKPVAKKYIAVPSGVPTYSASYSVAGYKLAFKAIGNSVVFNYVDSFTADEAETALRNLATKLPYVVKCGVAGPGVMVFNMSQPISRDAFNAFVDAVSNKAYEKIYPSDPFMSKTYEKFGYRFVFEADGNCVEFKFIDALSDAQKSKVLTVLAGLLPEVEEAACVRPGVMRFVLVEPINGNEFDKFVAGAKNLIDADLDPVNYKATYEVSSYKLAFSAVNNVVVFNYLDVLSTVELRDAVHALAARLPGVVEYGVAGPGIMAFELDAPISREAFDAFVESVSQAAYDVIY